MEVLRVCEWNGHSFLAVSSLTQTCMKLAFSRTCVSFLSLFLTPMFVLLQDSVPMASPAFLLSLFVSIQVLPQISPEPPGHAPHTLVSTQNTHTDIHNGTHSGHICLHLSSLFFLFTSILLALKEAKPFSEY